MEIGRTMAKIRAHVEIHDRWLSAAIGALCHVALTCLVSLVFFT